MRFRGLLDLPSKICAAPRGVGVFLTLLLIYIRGHEVSGSPRPSFKFIHGSMRFRGLLILFQIPERVHEGSGSPHPSFKFIYGSMGFRGLLDRFSN